MGAGLGLERNCLAQSETGFVWQVFRSDKMALSQEAGGKPFSHFSLDNPRPV